MSQGGSSSNINAKWSAKLKGKTKNQRWLWPSPWKTASTFVQFYSRSWWIDAAEHRCWQHWEQQGMNELGFTGGPRRKQRWNQSAGVQGRGRGRASAGSPARPGKPEHPSLPSSSALSTLFHLPPHYLNHAALSQAPGTWCLDPEYSPQTTRQKSPGWVQLSKGFGQYGLKLTFIAVLSASSLSCNFFSVCLAFLASLSAALLGTKKLSQLIGTTDLQQQEQQKQIFSRFYTLCLSAEALISSSFLSAGWALSPSSHHWMASA